MTQRSTKGASKQRRDAINVRVSEIRDSLPLSDVTRSRLSQLQVMALARSYIAKSNFFTDNYCGQFEDDDRSSKYCEHFDFLQTVSGFLLIVGLDGRLLYISESISDYLGNSAVDTLTQMETIFDLIDRRDQDSLRSALKAVNAGEWTTGADGNPTGLSFSCRMNTSVRNVRYVAAPTKTGFERCRVMQVQGRFILPASSRLHGGCYGFSQRYTAGGLPQAYNTAAFVAYCSPRLTVSDTLTALTDGAFPLLGDTTVFRSVHTLDMKFIGVDSIGEFYLDCNRDAVLGKSWYAMILPEDMEEAGRNHMELIRSSEIGDITASRSMCVRVQARAGDVIWLHVVMRMRAADEQIDADVMPRTATYQHQLQQQRQPLIVCINRVVDEQEAVSIRIGDLQADSPMEAVSGVMLANGGPTAVDGFSTSDADELLSTIDGSLFGSFVPQDSPAASCGSFGGPTAVVGNGGYQRQTGRTASKRQRKAGASSDAPMSKAQRMDGQMSAVAEAMPASFTSMPSPPLYQNHWISSSSSSGGYQCQQHDNIQMHLTPNRFSSSPFPSSFRSMTPPESVYGDASSVYGRPEMFGARSAVVKREFAASSPEYFMTPDRSPASSVDYAQSPSQSLVDSSSGLLQQDTDIYIPSSFLSPPPAPHQSPAPHTVPEPTFDDSFMGGYSAGTGGFIPTFTEELSFFDTVDPSSVNGLPASKLADTIVFAAPSTQILTSTAAAAPIQDSILINYDFLPELDLSSVTSILDCLETSQDVERRQSAGYNFASLMSATSGCSLPPAAGSTATAVARPAVVKTADGTGATIDEMLIQNLLSIGSEFLWNVSGCRSSSEVVGGGDVMMYAAPRCTAAMS